MTENEKQTERRREQIKPGDIVRLYGFPGTFTARELRRDMPALWLELYDFHAERFNEQGYKCGWPTSVKSIVEINGEPCPLLACPITLPAEDYPHKPTFCYDDGPAENAERICRLWTQKQLANA